jgi:hypothetical protein
LDHKTIYYKLAGRRWPISGRSRIFDDGGCFLRNFEIFHYSLNTIEVKFKLSGDPRFCGV